MVYERTEAAVHGKIEPHTAWAYTAVTAFARFTGHVEGGDAEWDIGTVISSLICELHRLVDAEGLDWGEVVARGDLRHFAESTEMGS
jgi:hypothetical protein